MESSLPLPPLFRQMCADRRFHRERGCWPLRSEFDCYGNRLETELADVYCEPARRAEENRKLPAGYEDDGIYGASLPEFAGPGAIDNIVEFADVQVIAVSADGAPFCLDYRENRFRPSVIWWDDVCWRRIAPDFAAFVALFDFDRQD